MSIIAKIVSVATLITLGTTQLDAQSRALGEWHGVLAIPTGQQLTLLIRVRDSAGTSLSGDLESIDQAPGQRMPLSKISASATSLTFSIPSIGATYDAQWNEAEQLWSGVFRQGMALPLTLKRGAPPSSARIDGVDGTWRGSLKRDTTTLRLVLHIRTTTRGTNVTLDSPDVGAMGLAVQQFERVRDTVRFRVPIAQVEFVGMMREGQRAFYGRWSRVNSPDAQVTFERDTAGPTARIRTQWPITAEGYHAEDVKFANPRARDVTLAGTITIPNGPGPFPAAVLISGSGPQDRDESLFGHKPFAVLADHLSRHGIAVLRYDDRGFAASTGDHSRATSADFATDANAAILYLLTRRDVDHKAMGFIGHSEGGMIGPLAAVENNRVGFLVLLAGPGTSIDQLLVSQRRAMGATQGASSEQLAAGEPALRSILHLVRDAPDSSSAVTQLRALLTDETLQALGATSTQRDALVSQYSSAWMRYFLKYEPSVVLKRVGVPVLALNGSLDRQVPSAENLAAMRVILAGKPDVTVRELPGLNHMFQPAKSGALAEYDTIPETFSPTAMELITDWIVARFGKDRP
ncbi:MAG: alpha/beta fold hydrolase [bacterium]